MAWFLQRAADGRDLQWVRAGRPGPGPFAEEGEGPALNPLKRAANLAWDIDRTLSSDLDMLDGVEKLNVRLERLSRLWVVGRGGDPRLFEFCAPGRVRDGLLAARSPESMGNPFLHPCAVAEGMAGRTRGCFRPFPARNWGSASARDWHDTADAAEAFQRFEMMRDYCRETRREGMCREGAGPGEHNGLDLATSSVLEELWERAWQTISACGYTSRGVTITGHTPSKILAPGLENINSDSPTALPSEPITNVLWSRLQLYAQAAETEATEVERLLEAKITGRMRSVFKSRLGELSGGGTLAPAHDGETGVFLTEIILLFNRTHAAVAEQRIAGKPLADSLHDFLMERFGPSGHFDLLKPSSAETRMRERIDQQQNALEKQWAQNTESLSRAASHRVDATARMRLAEENVKVAAEVAALIKLAKDYEREILDSHSDEVEDRVWAEGRMDPERAQRCLVAAATGMITLPGWKFESRSRCCARVGLRPKVKGKR